MRPQLFVTACLAVVFFSTARAPAVAQEGSQSYVDLYWAGDAVGAFDLSLNQAEEGNSEAQFFVAERYWAGDGVEQSAAEAIRWYVAAAEQGLLDAQIKLANIYYGGAEGVPADLALCAFWTE